MANYIQGKNINGSNKFSKLSDIDIYYAQHCPLSLLCEEVYELQDLNLFTIGTGECVFYTHKQPFPSPRLNWGFTLTDRELALGDLLEIEAALKEILQSPLHTVCVLTCIPTLAGMDLSHLSSPNITYISAAGYIDKKPGDIIADFYIQLLENKAFATHDETAVWDDSISSYAELCRLLTAKRHIVQNKKYLPLLSSLRPAIDIEMIDNSEKPMGNEYAAT